MKISKLINYLTDMCCHSTIANEDNSPLKQLFSIGKVTSKNEIKNQKFGNDANFEVFNHQK
jgi:hypothetical protein